MKFTNALGMPGNEMLLGKQTFFPDASLGGGLKDYAFYTNSAFKDLISSQPMQTTLDAGRPLPDNSGNVAGLNEPVLGENGLYPYGSYTNLVKWSEDLTVNWKKYNLGISTEKILAPDNTLTAYKLIEDTSDSKHQFYTTNLSSYTLLTMSFYAKAAGRNIITVSKSNWGSTTFNLLTEEVTAGIGIIKNVGNGWYFCIATYTADPAQTSLYFVPSDGFSKTYQGDGVSGLYLWGIQGTESPYALPYIKTEGSQVSVPINYSDANGGYKWPINSVDTPLLLDALDGKADGSLENSGSLVSTNRYQIITTETDHFGTGVVAGDRITGQTTALDANNTVKQISPAQGELQVEWVPGFNTADISGVINILTAKDEAISFLEYDADNSQLKLSDGVNTATVAYTAVSGAKATIKAAYGTHPTAGANKMQLIVNSTESTVTDFAGSFPNSDKLSVSWTDEEYQAIKSIKFYKEPKHWS